MTAAASNNVVPLRPQTLPAASVPPTMIRRLVSWSDSLRDEPAISLPDLPPELIEALPAAIEEAQQHWPRATRARSCPR